MALADILKTFVDERTVVKDEKGKYVEKNSNGVSLKGVLQRSRLRLRKERNAQRMGVSFAPSQITYRYCRRAKIGQLAGLLDLHYDKPAPSLQLVFDIGNAYHDIVQGYFWDAGQLFGDFRCVKCDKTYRDILAPQKCPSGKVTHGRECLTYKEVQIRDDEHRIKGRADGILQIDDYRTVLDIKSIANRTIKTPEQAYCFEDLETRGPKPEHIVQLMLYMWKFKLEDGHLLYVAKNDHKIKTFAIPYNFDVLKPYLEETRHLISEAERLSRGERVQLPVPCGRGDCRCDEVITGRTSEIPKFDSSTTGSVESTQ